MSAELADWLPRLDALLQAAAGYLDRFSATWLLLQVAALLACAALALLFNRRVSGFIGSLADDTRHGSFLRRWRRPILERVTPVIFLLAVWFAVIVFRQITWPSNTYVLRVVGNLTTAWIVINVLALIIRNRFLYRFISVGLWLVVAVSIVGLLPALTTFLDGVAVTVGEARISLLSVVQGLVLLGILLWLSGVVSHALDAGLARSEDLSPSIRVLIGKFVRVTLIAASVLWTVGAVGIDLTALAIFSGALGLGIGFGLQKLVSNFVAGITVLLDKSIKPGDVISLGETFGWITALNARYVSVVTRDGREHLIPNEQFITEPVINWSYSDKNVRIEVPFSVSYGSDPHAVKRLVEAACAAVPRVLRDPKPVVHFTAMADSGLEMLARVWIYDPAEGLMNLRSALLFAIWDALKENGIEVPFPQRDLHVKGPVKVQVEAVDQPGDG